MEVQPGTAQRQPSRAKTLWRAASLPSTAPQVERTWSKGPPLAAERGEAILDLPEGLALAKVDGPGALANGTGLR
jgi:hypothetical protein